MKTFVVIAVAALVLFGCVHQTDFKPIVISNTSANVSANTSVVTNFSKNSSTTDLTDGMESTPTACLAKYGIDEGVVFIYADWCPHCQDMKPLVQQLQREGFSVYLAPSTNSTVVGYLRECLSGIAQLRYIPEFVCPSNGKSKVGKFSNIDEMRAFFQACGA